MFGSVRVNAIPRELVFEHFPTFSSADVDNLTVDACINILCTDHPLLASTEIMAPDQEIVKVSVFARTTAELS